MKSKPQERLVETSCKECVFATYENDIQIDCFADRIDKFKKTNEVIEAYDDDKKFYVINRLCNLYRNERTKENLKEELSNANNQSSLSFDIFIECSDISTINEDLVLKFLDYNGKISIRLIHGLKNDLHEKYKILELSRKIIGKYNIDCPITRYIDYDATMHSLLSETRKSFHVILNKIQNVDTLNKVNKVINEDMKKKIALKCDKNLFISNLAYKIQSFNTESIKYLDNINEIIKYAKKKELYSCL